jgi:hypothetical protein
MDNLEHCCECDKPIGGVDPMYVVYPDQEVGPLCEDCRSFHWVCEECSEGVYPSNITMQETHKRCGGKCW